MRRSPRESAHSISASRGSCHFIFAPRRARNFSFRYESFRSRISMPSNGAHWNGVQDFGTKEPTATLTFLRPCLRPCARMPATSVTSSSRSAEVSVGRPIIV